MCENNKNTAIIVQTTASARDANTKASYSVSLIQKHKYVTERAGGPDGRQWIEGTEKTNNEPYPQRYPAGGVRVGVSLGESPRVNEE